MFRLLMKARFNFIEGNAFLETIVPKSSIKDQFVPLQIHKSEQLVPLLAINEASKHVPISSKGTQKRGAICSCFSRRDRSKIKKGNGSEKQNVLKNIFGQKGKKPKSG